MFNSNYPKLFSNVLNKILYFTDSFNKYVEFNVKSIAEIDKNNDEFGADQEILFLKR